MPPTPPHLTLHITALAGLGDGVGYLEGQKIFVPFSAPGDEVEVRIIKTGKEFSQAELVRIVSPGESRQTPPCKHFGQCGGCSLQHIKQKAYEAFKRDMLVQAVARAGLDTRVVAPLVYIGAGARRRTVLKVDHGRVGYYKAKSHTLLPITECPILEKPLEALLAPLTALIGKISVTEIALSLSDSGVDMVVTAPKGATLAELETLAAFAETHDLAGISWQEAGKTAIPVTQRRATHMCVGEITIPLPTGSFQQATRAGQEAITREIVAATSGARNILDLYAGCGGYSFAMAGYAKIHAIEGDKAMVEAIQRAAQLHGSRVTAGQRDLVKNPFQVKELGPYDAVVINPPRNGAAAQAEQLAKSKVPLVVMVSCNPSSFATDAKLLGQGGYALKHAVPIDQFTWSQHLELVAVFER